MSRCLDTDIDPKCLCCILRGFLLFRHLSLFSLDSINRFSREELIICLHLLIMLALDNLIFREWKTIWMD